MLAAAWLLPGLPLVLAGRFTAPPMAFMFAPLAAVLCSFAVRHLPATWPTFRSQPQSPQAQSPQAQSPQAQSPQAQTPQAQSPQAQSPQPQVPARPVPWWAVAGTVAVAAVFAVWQIAEKTEQIIFLREPSTYLQVGYWLAHHGSLPIPDSIAAFGGSHPGLSFGSVNYYPSGSGIVPQFMTGMPVVLAASVWLGGVPAALVTTPLIGACAVLSFGGLAGRLAGPRWAPAAAAVLALSLPEQYTSRSTFSEPLAQVLLFGGLCLLVDSLVIRRPPSHEAPNREKPSHQGPSHQGPSREGPRRVEPEGQDRVLAALAGLALGLTIFVRLDGLSDILPAVPFAGVLLAARRRQAIPFVVGLVIGVGYGLADGYLLSRPYLDTEAPSLRPLALITAVMVLLTVAAVVLTASRAAREKLGKLTRRTRATRIVRWLPGTAAALTVLVFAGFAVRPLLQTVAGETNPTSIAYVAELQKLAGLPIDGRQQYYQDSLYWVIWYIGVPAVLLGAFGLAILVRRGLRALIAWQDPAQALRVWAMPWMIALWVIVTVLLRPAVSPDQPWASKRLVPFVLPGLILGAIWASMWLKERAGQLGRSRVTSAVVASCCVASLLIPTALANLDLGFTTGATGAAGAAGTSGRHLTAYGMAFRRIGAGELAAVDKLCADLGPDASVLILDSLTADRFAQLVRGMCGTPTAVLDQVTPSTVTAVVTGIEGVGRRPVLLGQQAAELDPYGGMPREVVNLLTTQDAHNLTTPPTRTWFIHYTVWMSTPAATAPAGSAA